MNTNLHNILLGLTIGVNNLKSNAKTFFGNVLTPRGNNCYLTTNLTHFKFGYKWLQLENVLFNDTLNVFYLQLYSAKHMLKDHSDSELENPLSPLHGLHFLISSKFFSFICTIPDSIAYTMTFITPVMEHWLEWEIAQWVYHEESI